MEGKVLVEEYIKSGWELYELDRFKEATQYFDRALQLDAGSDISIFGKACCLYNLRFFKEAIKFYNILVEISYPHSLCGKGNCLRCLGNNEDALVCFASELESIECCVSLSGMGQALFSLDRVEDAVDYLKRALELKPNDIFSLRNYGEVLRWQGKWKEALVILDRSLEQKKDDPFALSSKGASLLSLGLYLDSLECLNAAISLDSSCSFAISQKEKLLLEFPIDNDSNNVQIIVQRCADSFANFINDIGINNLEDGEFYQKQLNEWTKHLLMISKKNPITSNQDLEFEWKYSQEKETNSMIKNIETKREGKNPRRASSIL